MEYYDLLIRCEVNINLNDISAVIKGRLNGRNSVFNVDVI